MQDLSDEPEWYAHLPPERRASLAAHWLRGYVSDHAETTKEAA